MTKKPRICCSSLDRLHIQKSSNGGRPVSLDGAQAEKAIPARADAGTRVKYLA
ncbi:MAG: hypothetical protein HFH40_02165 [Lachnospiraceae bacterium]|nr:hypothetical protein [Lachnospiraceae bacterium]